MKPNIPIMMFTAVLATAACGPREDRPAPGTPLTPDPAAAPAPPATAPAPTPPVPKLPDPQAPDGPTARDSKAANPKGEMTPQEESTAMPKPGQANTHSTPSLESSKDSQSK